MHRFVFSLVFVFAVGKVRMTAIEPDYSAVPDQCWFRDYICAISGMVELTDGGPFDTPEKCYTKCKELNDAGTECKFWTFWKTQTKTHCYSTEGKECVHEDSNCGPSVDNDAGCASGPGTCDATPAETCAHLVLEDTLQNKVVWTCPVLDPDIEDFDPYVHAIPVGTKCSAECSVWTDSDTPENHWVSSTCTGANTWGPLEPANVVDADGTPIKKPGEDGNPPCGCKSINIKANPTPEAGMELFCTDGLGGVDLTLQDLKQQVTITADRRCIMFCDRHLALDIECANEHWSENIEDCTDIYCWTEPTDCEP